MKISRFILYSTSRMAEPVGKKQSLIVQLVDEEGRSGFGEISPLIGRSIESFDEALTHTLRIREQLLSGTFQPSPLPPSVMFGLHSALYDLSKGNEECSFDFTTLSFEHERILDGIKDVKIKASNSLAETETRIRLWLAMGSRVRIDFGNRWNEEDVIDLVNRFEEGDILYVEDPVPISSLSYFIKQTNVAIALDEVVSMNPIDPFLKFDRISHFILKPSLIGGIEQCRLIVDKAREAGKEVVFSSLFETVIGLSHVVRMGKELGCKAPFGVDTIKYFSDSGYPDEESFRLGICKPFNNDQIVNKLDEHILLNQHNFPHPLWPAFSNSGREVKK